MAKDPKNPVPGDLQIDCTPLEGLLHDLPPGAMTGMRREREGFDTVLSELGAQQKASGARAGIPDGDVQLLLKLTEQIKLVQKYKRARAQAARAGDRDRGRARPSAASTHQQHGRERGAAGQDARKRRPAQPVSGDPGVSVGAGQESGEDAVKAQAERACGAGRGTTSSVRGGAACCGGMTGP